jgi:hypothetical protein
VPFPIACGLPSLIKQITIPTHFTFNDPHCAVGDPVFGIAVYGDPNRKPTIVLTNDLNAANGFTSGPVPDGIKAFFFATPNSSIRR